jgi:hypothetical protein
MATGAIRCQTGAIRLQRDHRFQGGDYRFILTEGIAAK